MNAGKINIPSTKFIQLFYTFLLYIVLHFTQCVANIYAMQT